MFYRNLGSLSRRLLPRLVREQATGLAFETTDAVHEEHVRRAFEIRCYRRWPLSRTRYYANSTATSEI